MTSIASSWSVGILVWFIVPALGLAQEYPPINDTRINESSGLAISWTVADRFWTHNDSGDTPRLFAIDGRIGGGQVSVHEYEIEAAKAIDWEDMASGQVNGRATLVVGDVGDNGKRRNSVTLYLIDESQQTNRWKARSIEVRYPDGPADCEALAIDVPGNRLLLITKSWLPLATMYAVPLTDLPLTDLPPTNLSAGAAAVVTAERVTRLNIPLVTAMDIRHDGRELAIASYRDLFVFEKSEDETWETALARLPKHAALPALKQIEGLCYDREGKIWVTSEGKPLQLMPSESPQESPQDIQ